MVLRLLFLSFLLIYTTPVFAGDDTHAKSAFLFADKQDWPNALSHAKQSGDNALVKLMTWEYLMDSNSGASFADISRFIDDNPNWPEQKRLHIRAEQALRDDSVPDRDIIAWFGDDKPITGVGKMAFAEALRRGKLASQDKLNDIIRDAWRTGDFDEAQEKIILNTYGKILTESDHIARIDRLLWEEKTAPAKRDLPHVPDGYVRMFKARISLISKSKLAPIDVALVPASLKNNPGLMYDRMRYRAHKDDDKGVRDILFTAPANPPYPEKWWHYREIQVRESIAEKDYANAMKLLAKHGELEGANLADAVWLQGWIRCEFQGQAKTAYKDFTGLYEKVHYPVSRSRAAYWAARAALRSGDNASAATWYGRAASFSTTFYGQLALLKINASTALSFPSAPSISSRDKAEFERDDAVRAIRLALHYNSFAIANRMLADMIETSDEDTTIAMLADLGSSSGYPYLSVRAAKKALQQNVVLIRAGYPLPPTPKDNPLERDLTLAITRQESEFNPQAESPSGALGMMQLLPGTAKEVAKKNDLPYSLSRMDDPLYNMTLGSYYLHRLIDSYDGSYVLAIGAYNAGPGNVRKWMQSFGTPDNDVDTAVNWIEKVPFSETRNYIQRVLENLQVFRTLEGHTQPGLGTDLKR